MRVGAPQGFWYAPSLFDVDYTPWVSLAGGFRVVYIYG